MSAFICHNISVATRHLLRVTRNTYEYVHTVQLRIEGKREIERVGENLSSRSSEKKTSVRKKVMH